MIKQPPSSSYFIEQTIETSNSLSSRQQKVKFIKLKFTTEAEIKNEIKKLGDALIECKDTTVDLKLDTYFQTNSAAVKFQQLFIFKLANNPIKYLEWKISGKFSGDIKGKSIGEILTRLPNLYSLCIYLYYDVTDKVAICLSKGLKYQINLSKLVIYEFYELPKEGRQALLSEMYSLPNIEKIHHNLILENSLNFPPKLASLNHCQLLKYDQDYNLEEDFDKEIKYVKERRDLLTEVYFFNQLSKYDDQYTEIENKYQQFLVACLHLPYLNRFNSNIYLPQQHNPIISNFLEIIKNLSHSRLLQILLIEAFNSEIKQYIPINSVYLLVELYID